MKIESRFISILTALTLATLAGADAEITIMNQAEGFLGSNTAQVTTTHDGVTQVSYDATGVKKLVVAIGTESGFNSSATVTGVTFNGAALTQAVQENTIFDTTPPLPGDFDGGTAAIFYLDNPFQGAATFSVSITSSSGTPNGGWVSIIGLAGTLDGVGNIGASWTTQASAGDVSTNITTSANNSLVIAMVENSGRNSDSGTPVVVAPLTLSNNGSWGSGLGGGAAGYQNVAVSGTTITPTFSTNAGGNIHVIAAEFKEDTIPPTLVGVDIVADEGTGPVGVNTVATYKLFFSEDMDASTVDASDFSNAGTSTITIGTITEDFPGEFTVLVTPASLGTLRLQVNAAAVLKDVAGNNLNTVAAIPADITIPVGLISNSGFENPGPLNDGEFTESASGWSQGKYDLTAPAVWIEGGVPAGYAGVRNPGETEYILGAAAEGASMGFVQTVPGFDIGMNQILSTSLQANTQYGLSVKVGNPSIYNDGLTTSYRIELLAGGVLLQSATGPSPVDGSAFITASLTHNSGATPAQLGQALEIRLLAVNDGSDAYEVDFDDVQLTVTASGTPYTNWTGGPFLGTLTNTSAALDFDNGGLDTGVEWVVGGDPTNGSDDASKAPTFDNTTDANFFIFTYNRTDAANTDPNTTIVAEYGSNLNGWTPAVHDGVNIIITPTDNGLTDSVQVKIKRTLAVGGSLFARLNVVVAP